jgi:non-reducing end alpha-L-arabinofuranosidase
VTAVGKPGTQAYLAADAHAGANNIKVTSVSAISAGDKIRLDIDSVGHGIETVTVAHVGTAASKTNLSAPASPGATRIEVRKATGFGVGDKITVGTPASWESVTVTAVETEGPGGASIDFTPAVNKSHVTDEWVVSPGTGLELAAPLQFNHAANLPFTDRGTGISFEPATAFDHSSNEPVQALGAGIALDRPLDNDHPIEAVVRDSAVKTAGYQGAPAPNLWFGGPELTTTSPIFTQTITIEEGSMVLRDALGMVADSLNYGALVDPWAAEGDQAVSGARLSGCYAPAPGSGFELWSIVVAPTSANTSTGRFPEGADTDSNCTDFLTQAAATLAAASPAGATNIKVTSVVGFSAGQTILIDTGANHENGAIATVGGAGATTLRTAIDSGATVLSVENMTGFKRGETITIDHGENAETAVVASIRNSAAATLTVTAPLTHAHADGVQISGSGISLTTPLTHAHASGAQVSNDIPTPGAPNQYYDSHDRGSDARYPE